MSGIKDTATVTLNINGAQAKQMMSELEQKISDTKKKISDLKANMADPKAIQKARNELKSYEKRLDEVKSATEGVGRALSSLDSASPRELEKALRTLNRQLKDMTPGTETWKSHIEKIKELKGRLAELKEEVKVQQSLWERFMNWSVGAWPAIDLINQGAGKLMDMARSAVDAFAEMDQEMANVRKFTGMTAEQVAVLNEEFKNLDTRTSREDLNKLAQEAGRLGKTSQEDVIGFVRAADKINVALDDLGEGATLTLSKLTGIFGDEKVYGTEQALMKVGSVINELSQNCAASAPYIAEFASRMGGVGAQAGLTIQQVMGFGAVLDTYNQKVEASSTALSQVITRMMQDPAKYARVAGLEVESFTKMLKEDANGALIMFLETLQRAGGMDVLSPMFKDMGETGARAISALSTLATHIEEVKAQQQAANVAFEEGTSVGIEFDVQNNTVQAGLEKCKKAAQEIRVELGQKLQPLMRHMLSSTSAIMRAMLEFTKFLSEHKFAVMAVTIALTNYIIALNYSIIATKTATIATKAWNVVTLATSKMMPVLRLGFAVLANSVQYFTNGLKVNYAMQLRWRTAMSAMKMTSWIGMIMAAVAALLIFTNRIAQNANKLRESREQMKRYRESIRDISAASQEYYAKEIASLKYLYEAALDESKSKEERIKSAKKLIDTYPEQFKNMTAEQIMLGNAKSAYDNLTESIILNAKAKAAADKIMENERKILEYEENLKKNRQIYKAADDEINKKEERNRLKSSQATGMASSFSGAIAMQSGATQGVYSKESTEDERKKRKEAGEAIDSDKKNINELRRANLEFTSRYKNNKTFQDLMGAGVVENEQDNISANTNPTASGSGASAKDKFAKEKEWREKEEALARIAYAKGEDDYEEYTVRMSQIQLDYNQKLLDRDDVTGTERLKIQADYWEASNKYTQAQHDEFVGIENASYEESLRNLNNQYLEKIKAGNLSAEERKAAEKAHAEALELLELEHLKRLTIITENGSDERNKAEQQYLDARLKAAKRHQQEYEQAQMEHEKRLASFKDKYFGMNESEKRDAYDNDIAALTEVYNAEILAAQDNADEKLRIEKAFQEAKLAIGKEYDMLSEENTENAMQKAVDSAAAWLKGPGGQALTATLDTLVSGMSAVFTQLSSLMQAELEIQTAAINKRYDAEIDRAQGNSYRIRAIEKQREAEQAKAKKEANRKMFALQVIQAVAQTAQNALNAFGSAAAIPVVGYILAPIAAAMAVAAGAIQIAAIKKQQQASEAQGFSKGGFTRPGAVDEPAGIVHAGEWVASQKLLANPVARPMIEALDYAQRTNTIGSIKDEDVSRSIRATDSMVRMAESDGSAALMVAAVARNAEVVAALNERLKYPIDAAVSIAGEHGIAQAESKYDRYLKNKSPKSY